MLIEWTPKLAVGLDVIDDQHKELYRRINQLLEACSQGKGREVVGETLKFLEDYVVTHFGNEENYMTRLAYPEYSQHKAQHTHFINNLKELKTSFEQNGPGLPTIVATNHLVVEWLNVHIRNVDTKLAAFLKDKL